MEEAYEEKLRKVDNQYNGLLAKERQLQSKLELKNAELENQMEEMRLHIKRVLEEAEDKENRAQLSSKQTTDK